MVLHSHDTILFDLVLPHDSFDRSKVSRLRLEHFVALAADFLLEEGAIGLLLLDDVLVDVLQVLVGQVLDALRRYEEGLHDGRVCHDVQEALHLVLLLGLHVQDWLVVWLRKCCSAEVDSLKLQIQLKGK